MLGAASLTWIHFNDGVYRVLVTLVRLSKHALPGSVFLLVHEVYILNLHFLRALKTIQEVDIRASICIEIQNLLVNDQL